jgi:hypothetical protein
MKTLAPEGLLSRFRRPVLVSTGGAWESMTGGVVGGTGTVDAVVEGGCGGGVVGVTGGESFGGIVSGGIGGTTGTVGLAGLTDGVVLNKREKATLMSSPFQYTKALERVAMRSREVAKAKTLDPDLPREGVRSGSPAERHRVRAADRAFPEGKRWSGALLRHFMMIWETSLGIVA